MAKHEVTDDRGARIQISSVNKDYGKRRERMRVIEDCTLTLEPGKLTVMIGPSGCGKSTLIRLIAGFESPSDGEISFDGQLIEGPSRDRLVLFQETALYPWMTTQANVLYGPRARGEPASAAALAAEALIERVGLQAFATKYPTQLSGGMQRRAELARALINGPRLMILDEPFRGLDAMTKALMQEYFSALYEEHRRTVLFVTTDIDEAILLADQLVIMTHLPTRVREVITVDIPRPRRLKDVIESDRANDVKMRALSLLHEEAMKSFGAGSRASADFVDAYAKRIGRA